MKKLQTAGIITAALSLIGYGCGRFVTPLPDWAMRTFGVLMLIAICVMTFSTARIRMNKE